MFFDSIAYAQTAGSGQATSSGWIASVMSMVPFIAIFAVFYFLLIRPQQKKQRELSDIIKNLKKGDKVLTQGGMFGVVSELSEEWISLKVGDKTEVKFSRNAISAKRD